STWSACGAPTRRRWRPATASAARWPTATSRTAPRWPRPASVAWAPSSPRTTPTPPRRKAPSRTAPRSGSARPTRPSPARARCSSARSATSRPGASRRTSCATRPPTTSRTWWSSPRSSRPTPTGGPPGSPSRPPRRSARAASHMPPPAAPTQRRRLGTRPHPAGVGALLAAPCPDAARAGVGALLAVFSARALLAGMALLCLALAACGGAAPPSGAAPAAKPAPAAPATPASADWDALVAAARQEGRLTLSIPPGQLWRQVIGTFEQDYPGIILELTGANSRDFWPRVFQEGQGGVYNWDLRVGGPDPDSYEASRQGVFDPIRPLLLLPEVVDDSKWLGGLDGLFVDAEDRWFPGFIANTSAAFYVNRDFIPESDLRTDTDILDPRWRGKIAIQDPRGGAGLGRLTAMLMAHGEGFVRDLLTKQDIVS